MQNVSSNNSEKALVPKLRFPEFTDSWELHTVGEYLTESKILGSNGKNAKKLTVKLWAKGVVEKNTIFDGSEHTQYYIRKSGQLMYGKLDFLNCAFGIVPPELDSYESTLDSPAFDISNINSNFILNRIIQKNFYKKNGDIANGSRKAKRIHPDVFLAMELYVPSIYEQNKISSLLELIDKKIQLQQQLIENLKLYKRGLLSRVFSNNNWIKFPFADIFETVTDKPYQIKSSGYFKSGKYEVVDQGKKSIVGYSNNRKKLFTNTPVIVYGDHTTIVKFRKMPFIIGSDGVKLLKSKNDINIGYLYYALLKYNIKPEGYKRHFSIIKNIYLPVPDLHIQIFIYNLFESLDNLINIYIKLMSATEKIKESLLQQIFI